MSREHTAPDRMTSFSSVPNADSPDLDEALWNAVMQDQLDSQPSEGQILEAMRNGRDPEEVLAEWLGEDETVPTEAADVETA